MFTQWTVIEQFVWLGLFILAGAYVGRATLNRSEHGDRRD